MALKDIENESLALDAIVSYHLSHNQTKPRIFVDVGANCGAWSSYAMNKFSLTYSFEPDNELYCYLKKKFANKNIHVHNVALSDFNGNSNFYTPINNGNKIKSRSSMLETANTGFEQLVSHVKVTKLDEYKLTNTDCIKIDVEGNELAAIKGGKETIKRYKPVLIVEIEERHHEGGSIQVFDYLYDLRYSTFILDNYSLKHVDRMEFKNIISSRRFNNFIFIHNDSQGMIYEMKKNLLNCHKK